MPDMVMATSTISIIITNNTNIITNTTRNIILIRWRRRLDTGIVGTGPTCGATVGPVTHRRSGRIRSEAPRCHHRDLARGYSGKWPQRKEITWP